MILLAVTDQINSIGTILQAVVALGTFALLFAQFRLQAGMFEMQQKITETQLKQAEIAAKTYRLLAIEHTHRIMPKFVAKVVRCTAQSFNGVRAVYELDLVFTCNLNIVKEFKFNVLTEPEDVWLEIDKSFEKSIINPGSHFDFRAKYGGRNERSVRLPSNLHFILEFKNDDSKDYVQHIFTSFDDNNTELKIRVDEPVLTKYVN